MFLKKNCFYLFFYIKPLCFRCGENIIPRLSKAVVDYAEDTKLVRAFFAVMDFIFVIDWVLTTHECRAVRKVLRLSDSKVKLTLKPRAISLRGARLLFRHITHLQKLWYVINQFLNFHTRLYNFIKL